MTFCHSQLQDSNVREIGVRVMTEIVAPFSRMKLDEAEFACLKAIVFFDPNSKGLKEVERIAKLRRQIQVGIGYILHSNVLPERVQ